MWDALWINGNLATMASAANEPYGAIAVAAIGVAAGRIAYVGRMSDLPDRPSALARRVHDLDGDWVTPGLIDCHTHIVYGGNRAREFELRLEGATYEEIARAGGGIRSTVAATRAADEGALADLAAERLTELCAEGVTTIEIKSGYGLDTETELKMLRVARTLGERLPVDVKTTFLGAHALPVEYEGRGDSYVDFVCEEMMPAVAAAGVADAVDAFCENIAFSVAQTERVFAAAQALGLPVKLHAEQLSHLGGATLAARFGALSADHLEWVDGADVAAMADAGTVAVLLPGAFYFLRETRVPPIDLFREHRVPIALATDSNPGSSPVTSLLLVLNMACTLFRLTPAEALAGVTWNAAQALGIQESHGTLEEGKVADFAIYGIADPAELSYAIGANPCRMVVKSGEVAHSGQQVLG